MRVYFVYSHQFENLLREEKVKILLNYPYLSDRYKLDPDVPQGFDEILIDSGGFQLQTGVAEVYLEAYSLWLQFLLPKHPEVAGYFNLDYEYPSDTLSNQFFLESEGLKPIPVYHTGEDQRYLDYYCSHYEWVSIGGLVSSRSTGKSGIARLICWLHQRYPNTKFHILGVGLSGIEAFRQFRPYSVDFSTWSTTGRFGHAIVEDKKQIAKEVVMSHDDKQRLRIDKDFLFEKTRESIINIKKFEKEINEMKDSEYQGLLL